LEADDGSGFQADPQWKWKSIQFALLW